MNTKLIAIVAGVVVVGAGAYFIFTRGSSHTEGLASGPHTAQTNQTSIKDLMSAGNPVACTFTSTAGGYTSSGTVYVAQGSMRGDFVTEGTAAGTIESHMIIKDNTNYMWTSQSAQGIKMTVDAQSTAPAGENQAVSYDSKVAYDCNDWSPDSSKFSLPSGITFSDMSSMLPGSPSGSAGASADLKAQQCAACNALVGTQQTQCKAALQCK